MAMLIEIEHIRRHGIRDARARLIRALMGSSYPEVSAMFFTFVWGLWVLSPAWNALHSKAFAAMVAIAPESIWGVVFCGVSGVHIFAWWFELYPLRRWMCAACASIWLGVCFMVAASDLSSPAIVVYPYIILSESVGFIRLRYRLGRATDIRRSDT